MCACSGAFEWRKKVFHLPFPCEFGRAFEGYFAKLPKLRELNKRKVSDVTERVLVHVKSALLSKLKEKHSEGYSISHNDANPQ